MKRKILIASSALLLAIPLLVVANAKDDATNKPADTKGELVSSSENEVQGNTEKNNEQVAIPENNNPATVPEKDNEGLTAENRNTDENATRPGAKFGADRPCMMNGATRGGYGRHHQGYGPSNQQQAVHSDMLQYVKEYVPEKLAEWKAVLEDREQLRGQWFSKRPAMNSDEQRGYGRGHRHHMNRMGGNAVADQDDFYNEDQMFCRNVYDAVRTGDKENIMKQLDKMLQHLKERNNDFQKRLQ